MIEEEIDQSNLLDQHTDLKQYRENYTVEIRNNKKNEIMSEKRNLFIQNSF